jgi:hypothetical protein
MRNGYAKGGKSRVADKRNRFPIFLPTNPLRYLCAAAALRETALSITHLALYGDQFRTPNVERSVFIVQNLNFF